MVAATMKQKISKTLIKDCIGSLRRNWRRSDIWVSIWCALSFIGLGTGLVIVSPTMLDIAAYMGVSLSEIAAMLLVRSVGSVVGSVSSGIIFDKFHKVSLWMLIFCISSAAILTVILPLSRQLPFFGVAMFIQGGLLSSLDTGVHAFLIRLWKNKDSGPIFQLIHFTFAVGAFIAPLIARPFISSISQDTNSNDTCGDDTNITDFTCTGGTNCSSSQPTRSLFHSVSSDCVPSDYSTSFIYAYWVASIPLLLSLPPLIVFAVKWQCCCRKKREDSKEEEKSVDDNQPKTYPDTMLYKTVLMILLFILILLYVAAEVAYGTYIFAFAVKGDLQFSKEKATILSSLFWGTFAFFRCFTIILSLCKLSPSLLLAGNLTGSLIASLIVTIFHSNELAVWIGSGVMGASYASLYPNIVVFLTRHGPASGKTSSILAAGATIGDTALPVVVGVLIDKVGPVSLCYFTLADVASCCCVFIALFIITHKCKVKKYYKLQDDHFEEENVSGGIVRIVNDESEMNEKESDSNNNNHQVDKTNFESEDLL
ncbi:PREDICTED: sodium-dependent glucose transporter 1A-like [Amphimedon queenslandica]|uniref:Major facilitator superfamily (MFS) profile domain-containing protein n=1 Tax=Amphimedon queenslandica TaxID=400682 RepID=A0A1X7UX58_AMPQE|nr:PREDICTED: sodium-dependent glucose transporter 1A-like [Amphimedon queenslandica]|eukprot:XP_011403951.1 PREDICTED: sodium-dependent glucose transporter 1A-like [Amphimedon queenslandica]